MCLYLLPQYCGTTILIDVCSNVSNPEEKKDAGDIKQREVISQPVNSSSPSYPTSIFGPHLSVRLPRNPRSRAYIQRFIIGAAHSGNNQDLGVVTSPSTSSMIVHPRSHSPSAAPDTNVGSSPPAHSLIRVDSEDDINRQPRSSPPDTDNDDGMNDVSDIQNRLVRVDTDNDVEFGGNDVNNEDDITDID